MVSKSKLAVLAMIVGVGFSYLLSTQLEPPPGPLKETRLIAEHIQPKLTDTSTSPNKQDYDNDYEFSTSWFRNHVPIWEQHLEPYRGQPNVRYLEIGLFEGRSAVWMLENILTHPTSELVGIDPFIDEYAEWQTKGMKETFMSNLEASGQADRCTILEGFSQEVLRQLPLDEPFDIIYIDGSHLDRDVLEDAILSARLLKMGGLLIFDDYKMGFGEKHGYVVGLPIDAFMYFYGSSFEVVHSDYQVILKKKQAEPVEYPTPAWREKETGKKETSET